MSPILIELFVLCFLGGCWLAFHGKVTAALTSDVYHVAAEKRDARKAKFYFVSVWVGLIAVFLSARCLEAFSTAALDSTAQRSWVMGSLRGMEMWGLLIVGAVWSRVGQRVTRSNSDGASLLPAPNRSRTND
jgi:hypothetical protein